MKKIEVTPGKIFIDTTNMIHQISSAGESWTATEDCFCVMGCKAENSYAVAKVLLDGEIVHSGALSEEFTSPYSGSLYVKKGQTVSTRDKGVYNLRFYKLMY